MLTTLLHSVYRAWIELAGNFEAELGRTFNLNTGRYLISLEEAKSQTDIWLRVAGR